MGIITNSPLENSDIANIYDWSIRKVIFRGYNRYTTYLIGYVPSYGKLEITSVNRIYLEQRVISQEGRVRNFLLCGQSGLTDLAEDIWHDYKNIYRISYETDISHKYRDLDDELYYEELKERHGPYFYMFL
jgi:hypothetical protein